MGVVILAQALPHSILGLTNDLRSSARALLVSEGEESDRLQGAISPCALDKVIYVLGQSREIERPKQGSDSGIKPTEFSWRG
jgi:hypothetical protein